MWIEARVTQRGTVCPAFQVDECFAEEISRYKWCLDADGYLICQMKGKMVKLARYIWLLHTGDWPKNQMDHISRDKLDNRTENLRDVSCSENLKNREPLHRLGKPLKKPSDLPTGVLLFKDKPRKKPYRAHVKIGGKDRHLGFFPTAEEAHAAYLKAVQEINDA